MKDENGEPLPGASVIVENQKTGEIRGAATGRDGQYVILSVPSGTYTAKTSFIGYQAVVKPDIELSIGQTLRVDFVLQEQTMEMEEVQVVAGTPVVEIDEPSIATTITPAQVENLPTFSRNILDLAILSAGARSTTGSAGGINSPTGIGFKDFLIDGVSYKDRSAGHTLTGGEGTFISQLEVASTRIVSHGYDAQYSGGTRVYAIETKRGTNEFRGSAFINGYNDNLRARGAFEEGAAPDFSRYQFGAHLDGPIIRDKLFFAVTYEQLTERNPTTYLPGQPSYAPDLWSEYAGTRSVPAGQRLFSARLTFQPAGAHTLNFTYRGRRDNHNAYPGGQVTEAYGWGRDMKYDVFSLTHSYTPRANLSNELIISYLFRQYKTTILDRAPTLVYPSITLGPNNFIWPLTQQGRKINVTNDFTYLKRNWYGDHIFKAGLSVSFSRYYDHWPLNRDAIFTFATDTSAAPIKGQIAVGRYDRQGTSDATVIDPSWLTDFYIQDEWTPFPSLTLSLGLRYSLDIHALNNSFAAPEEVAAKLRDAGIPEAYIPKGERKNDFNDLAPRLGFSWDLFGGSQTALFGGYARSYARPPHNDVSQEERYMNWVVYTILSPGTTSSEELREMVLSGSGSAQPSLTLLSNDIENPTFDDYSIGIKHRFSEDVAVSTSFVYQRMTNGFGTYNANPLTSDGTRKLTQEFGDILLSDERWDSKYYGLLFTLKRAYRNGWSLQASYTLGRSLIDVVKPNSPGLYENVSSSTDERHHLVVSGIYQLPLGFMISGIVTIASPSPLSLVDGRDPNGDLDFGNDYLSGEPYGWRPDASDFGNWYRNINLRLSKSVSYREATAEVYVDVFNVLNTTNYSGYATRKYDAKGNLMEQFKEPIDASVPRRIQVGLRVSF